MYYKKIFIPFLCVFISLTFLNAQVNIDSLKTALKNETGSSKADLLITLCWELKYSDQSQALAYCRNSIDLSKAIKYDKGEALAYYYLAAILDLQGNYAEGLEACAKAFALFKKLNDSLGLAKIFRTTRSSCEVG